MKTVAIISEYNPFHSGHLHQIKKIKEIFGEDTRIVAIMSGNFTQRGEIAFLDKSARAKMAVLCGVNLVLELPFPYSMASAEIFASAGVSIADALGCLDVLSFGSEIGELSLLSEAARITASDEFAAMLKMTEEKHPSLGHAALTERVLSAYIGKASAKRLLSPNNILAIEYIKALMRIGSKIEPHTVLREGSAYGDEALSCTSHSSASAIRAAIRDGRLTDAAAHIPAPCRDAFIEEIECGSAPTDEGRLDSAILSYFRLNKPTASCHIQDAEGGLYNRLITKSYEATDIFGLTALTETKKFTKARIRRAILYSFFGVTSSDARSTPGFTRVLALDKQGQAILREAKASCKLPIVTKPSESLLNEEAERQKSLADRADAVFQLTKPKGTDGSFAMRTSPFFKG